MAFDPLTNDATRKEHLAEFLKIPKGSKVLDPGLFRKLRDVVEIVDDLLQPDLFDFVQMDLICLPLLAECPEENK